MNAWRFWHTVRHLKPVQVYGRLKDRLPRPRPDLRPAPRPRQCTAPWREPIAREPSLVGPRRFRFLNQEHEVIAAADWNATDRDRLWLYHLHYFDDLNASGAVQREAWHRDLIAHWIQENPPAAGVGWEPYPTSLRIVNWIKWAWGGRSLATPVRDSLAVQTRQLARQLEYRLLGNHLLANAKALVFAGLYFDGPEARHWLARGLRLWRGQLAEQILADGGHFERSPMYHAAVLEDVLDVANAAAAQAGSDDKPLVAAALDGTSETIAAMGRWLRALTHPDGRIAFFNDAALGVAPGPDDLEQYAARLGLARFARPSQGTTPLADSGYYRLAQGPAVAIFDAAPLGPDYLPGHAHADTLSLELSLGGARLIVNSGTSTYRDDRQRRIERSTAAHSTVEIDGHDSSEMWGAFRVARRARVEVLQCVGDQTASLVEARHDGYRRLGGGVVHSRRCRLEPQALEVCDELTGRYTAAVARFHLHPDVQIRQEPEGPGGAWQLAVGGRVIRWQIEGGQARFVAGSYHPEFGLSLENRCLEVRIEGSQLVNRLGWD